MSTTLWANGDTSKKKKANASGAAAPSASSDLSYGANTGAGRENAVLDLTKPTAGKENAVLDLTKPAAGKEYFATGTSYSENSGTAYYGEAPSTAPATGETPSPAPEPGTGYGENSGPSVTAEAPSASVPSGNGVVGTPVASLPAEMANFDKDGDGVMSRGEYEAYKLWSQVKAADAYEDRNSKFYLGQKETTYKQAEEDRKRAEAEADLAHERAVVDAHVSGEQNKASYGAKAERLASMGLSGGGYSDYLDAQAYAQSRGEIQAAGAQKETSYRLAAENESDTKLAADLSYGQNILNVQNKADEMRTGANLTYADNMQAHDEKEREKQEATEKENLANAEASILTAITAGEYKTKDEAIAAARAKGITDENVLSNIGSQWTIWDNGVKNNPASVNAFYNNVKNGDYATLDEAIAAAAAMGITDPAALENIDNEWTAWAVSSFGGKIESGEYADKDALKAALAAAGITKESVITELCDKFDVASFTRAIKNGTYKTKAELNAALSAAGVTKGSVLDSINGVWDTYESENFNQKDDIAVFESDIGNGKYATWEDALAAAAAKGITDENVLSLAKDEWTAWAVSSFDGKIKNGEYADKDALKEALKAAGITDESVITELCDTFDIESFSASIKNGTYKTKADLDAALDAAGVTSRSVRESINSAWGAWYESVKSVQNENADYWSAIVEEGGLTIDDISEIEEGVKNDVIDAEDAAEWREQWVADYMETEDPFLDENMGRLSKKDATKEMNEIVNSPWCTPELKAHLQAAFNKIYSTTQIGGAKVAEEDGNLIEIEYGGKFYVVQKGSEASGDVVAAAAECNDGVFFVYGDSVYFKDNGKVYPLENYPVSDGGYDVFVNRLKVNGVFAKATPPAATSTTTSTGNGGSVTQNNYTYDHGGSSTEYTITNPDGTTEKIWSVHGH